jgi:hypothetical protein
LFSAAGGYSFHGFIRKPWKNLVDPVNPVEKKLKKESIPFSSV